MKKSIIDKAHDRIWRVITECLSTQKPLPDDNKTFDANSSVSGTMDWPRACAALAGGEWSSKNFRRNSAVRQVVETLGPVDGKHFAQWIQTHAPEYLTDRRVAEIDAWGDPIRWPGILLGTSHAFSPTTLRYLAHALWLKKEGFVKECGKVVEIGVGFGGLAAMNALVSNAKTLMVDLEPVAKSAMRLMHDLGLSHHGEIHDGNIHDNNFCVISNYAFTELSRELQDAYVDKIIRHADRGVILSNASVFADHMKSRNNDQIIDLLQSHSLPAKISTNHAILCQSDTRFGNALVLWKRIS